MSMSFGKPTKRFIAIISCCLAALIVTAVICVYLLLPRQWQGMVNTSATVSLPNYYKNGIVFQREQPIYIKGSTAPDTQLTVIIGDDEHSSSVTTIADKNGLFAAYLDALPAQLSPYTLSISSGDTVLMTIDKTYVGDVFLAAGQSNMEVNFHDYYSTDVDIQGNINGVFHLKDLPELINDAHVHFLITDNTMSKSIGSGIPLRTYCSSQWLKATPANSKYLGYLPQAFAATLRSMHPHVPIGIIQTAWGGSGITEHIAGGHIYKTHIKPLQGFNLGGIIWYQGEKDAMAQSSVDNYTGNFLTLIRQYRKLFGNDKLPFLYVQLARYSGAPYTSEIQIAQLQTLKGLGADSNVAMTVALDTDKGTSKVIHPLGKDILGNRLAQQWVAMHNGAIPPSGPIANRAIRQSNGSIAITFQKNTNIGLHAMKPTYSVDATPSAYATSTSQKLTGFEILRENGAYSKVQATISGKTVILHTQKKDKIVSIRYAWTDSDVSVLLYNNEQLPASPFILTVE